jgi:DNA-binding transcriptional LysR family regulator
LFLRERGRIRPTPAGDLYYRECVEVLRGYDRAGRAVRAFASGLGGEVVAGLMPTLTRCALAPALTRFVDANPNVLVSVVEGFSATLTDMVLAGRLDFAIVPAFGETPGVRQRRMHRTAEVLLSSAGCGLPDLSPVRLGDLAPLKLVMPARRNVRRPLLEAYLRASGAVVERTMELDTMHGTLDVVARSDWKTILPAVMLMHAGDATTFCRNPLAAPPLELDLVLIEPTTTVLSPAAEAFAQALLAETRSLDAGWGATIAGSAHAPAPLFDRGRPA